MGKPKWVIAVLLAGIMLTGYGGLCGKKDSDSGSSAPQVTPTNPPAFAYAIAIDATYMYVVGADQTPGNQQWRIEKRNLSDSSLVASFGTAGVVTSNPSTATDIAYAMAIDATYLYVVGSDESAGVGNSQWRIEKRNLSDGALVAAFDTDGIVTSNPSSMSDYASAIAIDATYLYVVGVDYGPGETQWRIEKRNLSDGALVAAFDTDGIVTSNPSTSTDRANAIVIDASSMYVAGIDSSSGPNDTQWRIEKRNLSDGALDAGFGTGGVRTSDPSTGWEEAFAIARDATDMYVVGSDRFPGNEQWRIEKRNLTDGSLVAGFGTAGVVKVNPTDLPNYATNIAIDATYMYVVGLDYQGLGNAQWRIEKRNLSDGALVTSFGTGGVVTSDPGPYVDAANALAIGATSLYVVGYDTATGTQQWRIEKIGK
ncbi:MAG: hypothetical protein HY762_01450 [Planctomycetes bacterium]|nr:hypothetical protein [Planctomycetota bacterium]